MWNWKMFYNDPVMPFRPTDLGGDTLMTCDMFLGWDHFNPSLNGERWTSSHPGPNSYKDGWSALMLSIGDRYTDPKVHFRWMTDFVEGQRLEIKMNAGYLDGHVERTNTKDYYQWDIGLGEFSYYLAPYPFK